MPALKGFSIVCRSVEVRSGELSQSTQQEAYDRRSVVKVAGWSAPAVVASLLSPNAAASPKFNINLLLGGEVNDGAINVSGHRSRDFFEIRGVNKSSSINTVKIEILVNIEGRSDKDETPLLEWENQDSSGLLSWSVPQNVGESSQNGRPVRRYVSVYQHAVTARPPATRIPVRDFKFKTRERLWCTKVNIAFHGNVTIDGQQVLGTATGFQSINVECVTPRNG